MDTTLLIEIVVAIFIVWLFVKFIVNPVLKIVVGIIIFLFLIYILQRFFGLSIDKLLAPFGISLNLDSWVSKFNWLFSPLDGYINKIKDFIIFAWAKIPKPQN